EELQEGRTITETLTTSPECTICYLTYDNVFKTPLLLPCSHTFCMECLSRLCLFLKESQSFPCPLCRTSAPIPPGGVPKMQPNVDVVSQLPPDMQNLQNVWLDGHKLCWVRKDNAEQGKGSLVTVHLLPNREGPPSEDHLVSVNRNLCLAFLHSVWGVLLIIFTSSLLLFTLIFLLVYMNRGK
uniref:RING-type domain-containing protein n=1 Tax=Leptobrachium leishanense TaxID=445787 RepID=A0A8C5R7F2_9ANUR